MSDVFVSYRRADSSDVTGRICDQLRTRLGAEHLFKDVESIPLGKDFRTAIAEAVGGCSVLLAVIGREWLRAAGEDGGRRIDDRNDFVHIEIAAALARGIPVIPVLVENAAMPRAADLPAPLAELAFRNGTQVRPDPDFHHDIDRLCTQLAQHLPAKRVPGPSRRGSWRQLTEWILAGVLAFAILAAVWWAAQRWLASRSSAAAGGDNAAQQMTASPPSSATASGETVAAPQAPLPIRFWIKDLPQIPGEDAAKLFNNALGSWQAVVVTPIRRADSEAEANVIVVTAEDALADAQPGPPTRENSPRLIRFGATVTWTPRTFEAASARMLGHILGLTLSDTDGQIMSKSATLDTLPLTPQPEDIRRVREIWDR